MLHYPAKIIIAFGEAIDNNIKIHNWLLNNGYPELAALASSIHAKSAAFEWLLKHYPKYAVLSNAIDGEKHAIEWLKKYKLDFLVTFAEVCNKKDKKAINWLKEHNLEIFITVGEKIHEVILQQRRDATDYHKMSFYK
jgi:hypothetical protein